MDSSRKSGHEDDQQELVEVPFEGLAADTLRAVIEAFILREGTNYGDAEVSLTTTTSQVLKQLQQKKVRLVFDPTIDSCTLLTEHELKRFKVIHYKATDGSQVSS